MTDSNTKLVQQTTLFIAMLTSFVNPFAGSSLNIALPAIGADFQAAATLTTWVISAMMLTNVSLSVPFGRFADLVGKRRVFNLGIVIFATATLLCGFAPSIEALIALRVFQGFGGAMIIATNMAILMDVFPPEQRGRVLGLTVMCVYLGLSGGPVIGGFLTHHFHWRMIFYVTSAMSFLSLLVSLIGTSKLPKQTTKLQDAAAISPISVILYLSAMVTFMFGFMTFAQNTLSYISLCLGVVLFVVFGWYEQRSAHPVLEVRLFKKNKNFVFSNLSALFNFAATFGLGVIMAIYLKQGRGFTEDFAGLILVSQPIVMALTSPIAGRLSDKWSPFMISSIGMGICSLSMIAFLFIDLSSPLSLVIINLMVIGFGIGIFSSPNTNAVMSCVTKRDFGVANSILNTLRSVGQVTSMAIITIIMHFTIGDAPITEVSTEKVMEIFHVTFIVFAIICALGVLLSLNRKQNPVSDSTEASA